MAGLESLEDGPTEAHTASEADHNPAEDVCALVRGVETRLAERLDALMLACAPAAAASTAAGVLSAAAVAAEAPAPLSDDAIAALDEGALRAELRARDEALAKLVRVVMPLARAVRHQQKAGPASKDSGKGRQRSSARSLDDATPTPSSARGSLDALPDSPGGRQPGFGLRSSAAERSGTDRARKQAPNLPRTPDSDSSAPPRTVDLPDENRKREGLADAPPACSYVRKCARAGGPARTAGPRAARHGEHAQHARVAQDHRADV